ncbi:Hypothetical predicted protein [Mytilus galloprovincialis]|uniref:DUF4371 domain-containing protein n=1 Tax=Mytilus galloprovincialis TaxID=29158 RepID=A0A8B6DXZ3_MYTGA|nr:Hypothetical predicted protein [Mytilus galloprovincialis]
MSHRQSSPVVLSHIRQFPVGLSHSLQFPVVLSRVQFLVVPSHSPQFPVVLSHIPRFPLVLRHPQWAPTPSVRYKKSAVKDHSNSEQHKTAVTLELTSRTSVFQKDFNLKAAFFALYWLMKEETPNSKFSSIMLLAEKMGHPSIKHFRYTSARTIREMMLTIGHHIGDEVAEKIRNSGVYGLLVDEVTDLSVKQQMVCFVQYIDDSGLGHIDVLDIANVLSKNELDVRNCSSFVSDGASVMVGKKNGVAAKLKNIVPTLLSVHCICHRLALACTDTNKDIEYISILERIFTQLWKYFDDSPKLTAALLKTQLQTHQIALHTGDITKQKRVYISRKMKKACKTRWVSFDNSVKSTYGDLPAVLQTL